MFRFLSGLYHFEYYISEVIINYYIASIIVTVLFHVIFTMTSPVNHNVKDNLDCSALLLCAHTI